MKKTKTLKKIISVILVLLMSLFSLSACGASNQSNAAAVIGLIGADSSGKGAAAEQLGKLIEETLNNDPSNGINVKHYPGGELGGDADLLRQVKDGDISYIICQPAPAVSFIPELAVFDAPMAFSDLSAEEISAVLNGPSDFNDAIKEAAAQAGYQLLGFMQGGTFRLTTAHKPLSALEDFAHLQIRTMENNNHMQFWKAIGAEPTPLAWAEVYFALQSGTIDAQENAADTCLGANFQEVQEYLCCTNHILYVNVVLMNKALYDSLSSEKQVALTAAVSGGIETMSLNLSQIDLDSKEDLIDGGMTLIEYGSDFFDRIRSLDSVKELYTSIDSQTDGLLSVLTESLASAR